MSDEVDRVSPPREEPASGVLAWAWTALFLAWFALGIPWGPGSPVNISG